MKERDRLINLYEIYKCFLAPKQQEYFENYYLEDLSLSEISDDKKVSRAIINKTVKIVEEKLNYYEKELGLYYKNIKLQEIISKEKNLEIKKELEQLL